MKTETRNDQAPRQAGAPGRARQVPVPPEAKAVSRLSRIDYADAFEVPVRPEDESRTGEQWARIMLEGASARTQRTLRLGWTMLGLKLGPSGSAEHVLGWTVEHSGADHALLNMESRTGMPAELLFKPKGDRLLFCTFIDQRNPLMKAVWWPVEGRHIQVVPQLLDRCTR